MVLYGYVLLFRHLFHFANPSGNQDGNGNSLKISASCHKSAHKMKTIWCGLIFSLPQHSEILVRWLMSCPYKLKGIFFG